MNYLKNNQKQVLNKREREREREREVWGLIWRIKEQSSTHKGRKRKEKKKKDSGTKLEFILVHVPQIHGGDIEMKLKPP
jgi:hypothetical protein